MPLGLLIASVLVGVSLVGLSTWWVGWSADAALDADVAERRFLLDFPGETVEQVTVAREGTVALLKVGSQCAAVFVVGDAFATRWVPWSAVHVRGAEVGVDLHDFATPALRFTLSEPAEWLRGPHA